MLWLLFPLIAVVILVIFLALPVQAALGYLAVIAWIAFMLYLVFYRGDPVTQALQKMDRKEAKK
jgi:hypothetical protein